MVTIEKRSGRYERRVFFDVALPDGARHVTLVGSFNGWDAGKHVMQRDKTGRWECALYLPQGQYEYRFLVDGDHWLSDPEVEASTPNPYGSLNSVVVVS